MPDAHDTALLLAEFHGALDGQTKLLIGELNGKLAGVLLAIERIQHNQEGARLDLEKHAALDQRNNDLMRQSHDESMTLVRQALGDHRDQLRDLQHLADTVDANGAAIADIEKRVDDLEEEGRVSVRTWQRLAAVAGVTGALAGSTGSGIWPRIGKAIAAVFR